MPRNAILQFQAIEIYLRWNIYDTLDSLIPIKKFSVYLL